MDRRLYLSTMTGLLTGLAGCGANTSVDTDTSPTTTKSPAHTQTNPGLKVSVETDRYLVRSFAQDQHQRAIESEDIVPLGDIDDPLRSALEAAVEGVYTTEEIGTDLLAGIDQFRRHGGGYRFEPYFSANGIPQRFDPSVPVFMASLDTTVENAEPDRTITHGDLDDLPEPAADFVRTLGAFSTMVARDEYRISVVPPSVEALLNQYEYIRDPADVGRIVTERVDPGPPYTIRASELTADEMWGRPVLAAAELPAELRRLVETVVTSDRRRLVYPDTRTEYRTDDLPPSYGEYLGPDQGSGSGPYVELDGTMYAFRVTEINREHVPLAISAMPNGAETFELTIAPSEAGSKPTIDGPVEIESTWAVPGPLWIHADGDRYRIERVDAVVRDLAAEDASAVEEAEMVPVPADGGLIATYQVPADIPPGTYRVWGLVRVSWVDAESDRPSPPSWPFPFQIVLTVPQE